MVKRLKYQVLIFLRETWSKEERARVESFFPQSIFEHRSIFKTTDFLDMAYITKKVFSPNNLYP